MVRIDGEPFGPHEIQAVFIGKDCPVELFDLAVDSGYFILGLPGRKVQS